MQSKEREEPQAFINAIVADQQVILECFSGDNWRLRVIDTGVDAPNFDPANSYLVKEINTEHAAAIMALLIGIGEVPYLNQTGHDLVAKLYAIANPVFVGVHQNLRCIP